MLKRSQYKCIYAIISNAEKKKWALKANYTSYHGLYRYLSAQEHAEEIACDRIDSSLKNTIGEQRYNQYVQNIARVMNYDSNQITTDFNRITREDIARSISNCNNTQALENIKAKLQFALDMSNNQIERLRILDL